MTESYSIENWPFPVLWSVFVPIPKRDNAKECSNFCTTALISRQQSNVQNSPSQASTVLELGTSRCSSWISKRQRSQRWNCQHLLDHRKSKGIPEKHLLLLCRLGQCLWLGSVQFSLVTQSCPTLFSSPGPQHTRISANWKILQEI